MRQSPLHPPSAASNTPSSSTPPQRTSREGVRERSYRGERDRDRERERERSREEQRPQSVVDLTQDGRGEEDRRVEPDRGSRDEDSSSRLHHNSNANANNSNPHSERHRRNDSVATSAGTLHISYVLPPALQSSAAGAPHLSTARESVREQRISAPTYVPSVEVYDEQTGPIQIASQARDNKHRDRERERDRDHPRLSHSGDLSNQREEGSVICSNGSVGKRNQDASLSSIQSRFSPETRDISKHSNRLGIDQQTHTRMSQSPHTSHRHNSNTQSTHSHSPQTHSSQHGHGRASEEGSQRRYLDPSALYRPGGSSGGERGGGLGSDSKEVSAMQSLIKYSGNFAAEGPGSSRNITDGRGPFGGLGNIGMERDRIAVGSGGSGTLRMPQLKREQERPDSARSFGREGEGEVRHPPVGIAVAVARQRDSGATSKQTNEERGEDRARHHNDRLLAGRLEREQEKVLRESKELAEFTQMHPAPLSSGLTPGMMTSSLMTPNLMVTGGAALAGAGRWPPDPSTLTSHPWIPRSGAPPVWLSGSPYSLGPSSLHQTLPPGYPPSLPGSMPPPYQFARDPQSGQLIVIPSEHLPHYGRKARGAPVWSGVYGTTSTLQHAAQLQLLSQQQILRQHELLMIQQHTAQVLELQRNAQIAVSGLSAKEYSQGSLNKASEHRPEIEDKADKRNTDSKPRPSSISSPSPSPVLHPRKPPPSSRSPTPSTSSLTPLPRLPSPVTTLKSEEGGQRVLSPPKPLPHPPSPRSASPPPSSPRRPKQEMSEEGEVGQREQREGQKPTSAPFQKCISTDSDRQELSQTCASLDQTTSVSCEQEQPDSPVILDAPSPKESLVDPPLYPLPAPTSPLPLLISSEDPMAGMLALLTASEMVHPLSITPPAPTLIPQIESCSTAGPMEMVALEGMALLSQMAQQELENSHKEQVFSASHPDVTLEGLDCLLEASKQILLEAIEKQSHIDLPRTLDPNKKYSWRQRKEEPLYSKLPLDVLDTMEVELRVRLAELQKTYKEKQRELSKLQRRRDKRKGGYFCPRVGRAVQYSEDSEAGEGQRKKFRVSREEEETEAGSGGLKVKKKKKKSWNDTEPSTSHPLEVGYLEVHFFFLAVG
uniref:Trinucleotide repeat containing 18 n=1 Tax=Neolamprologus brichardi TaxID=32507 RepID=A0A3Q4GAE1_NEOBR